MDELRDEQPYAAGDAPDDEGGQAAEPVVSRPAPVDYEPTGVEAVDRVLAEVTAVVDAPVGEHVQVFERAHEQLRRALDAQPDPTGDDRDA